MKIGWTEPTFNNKSWYELHKHGLIILNNMTMLKKRWALWNMSSRIWDIYNEYAMCILKAYDIQKSQTLVVPKKREWDVIFMQRRKEVLLWCSTSSEVSSLRSKYSNNKTKLMNMPSSHYMLLQRLKKKRRSWNRSNKASIMLIVFQTNQIEGKNNKQRESFVTENP